MAMTEMLLYLKNDLAITIKKLTKYFNNGVNPNIIDNKYNNALHCYFYNKCVNKDIVKLLLSYDINLLHKNNVEETPLAVYSSRKNIDEDIVKMLLEAVNYKNVNDFNIHNYIITKNVNLDFIKLLMSKKLKLSIDENDRTVFEKYVETDYPNAEILDFLIKHDTNNRVYYNICDSDYSDSDSDSDSNYSDNINYSDSDDSDYIKEPSIDKKLFDSKTALHLYINSHCYTKCNILKDVVQCLIDNNIYPWEYDITETTAVQYYIRSQYIDPSILTMLIGNADACIVYDDITGKKRGVLMDYLNSNYRFSDQIDVEIVKLLLKTGNAYNIMCNIGHYWLVDESIANMLIDLLNVNTLRQVLKKYLKYYTNISIQLIERIHKLKVDSKNIISVYFNNKHINLEVLEYLLKQNPNMVNYLDRGELLFGKMISSYIKNEELFNCVNLCMKHYTDVNLQNCKGENIMMYAIKQNNTALVKYFIKMGVNPHVILKSNKTYISYCINHIYTPEISKLLLDTLPNLKYMKKTIKNIKYFEDVDNIHECISYMAKLDISSLNYIPNKIQRKFKEHINNIKNKNII
ncbi:ankyrin repeat protein [Eptesipox virus]|nr:ankyrin repeat-containing protein [Eptesipox virus]WAH71141.1 ankyrin repeat protein [Eptesipox virus]